MSIDYYFTRLTGKALKHYLLKYFWLLLFGFSLVSAHGQTNECNFSEPTTGTSTNDVQLTVGKALDVCESGAFTSMSDIIITEVVGGERAINGDDTGSLVLTLELPDGLEFKRMAHGISVTTSGAITLGSINVQTNAIIVFLSGATPSGIDGITVSGIEIRQLTKVPGNYNLTVRRDVGCVNGIVADGSTIAGNISVLPAPLPPTFTFNAGPNFCIGDHIPNNFLAVSSGENLRYFSDEALSLEIAPFADINNPTPAELGFTSTTPGTKAVYVVAESAAGCSSSAVKVGIEVFDDPSLDLSAIDGTICPGEKIEIDLRNYSNGSLSWVNNNANIGLSPSGGDFIFFTAAQNSGSTAIDASVVVSASWNGCVVTDTIFFSLQPGPAIGAFSPAVEICNISGDIDLSTDNRFKLALTNGGIGGIFSYSGKGITNNSGIFNASSQSWADNELVDIDVTYTRSDGCLTTRRLTMIKVISNPQVTIASPLDGTDQCKLTPVKLTLETNNQTSSVSWQTSGNGTFSGTFNSALLTNTFYYNPGITDAGPVILSVTTNNPGAPCTIDTDQITINIFEPVVAQQSEIKLCPAETLASIDFTSATMPGQGVFSWEVGNKNLLGLLSNTGTGSITGIKAAANTTGSNLSTTVKVTQTVDGCTSNVMSFNVVVKPQPLVAAIPDKTVCPGELVAVGFSSIPADAATVYNWTSNNTAIGLAASGTGAISFAATNTTAATIQARVSYTATLNGCVSEAKSFLINVKPTPQVKAHANIVVCSGAQVVSALESTVAGATFNWTIDNPLPGMPASGSGDLNFATQAHYGTTDVIRTVRVKATKDGCTGAEQTFDIVLKPLPKVNAKADVVIFPETAVPSIGFSDNSGENSTFSWTATNAAAIGLPAASGTGPIPAFTAAGNTTGASIISTVTVNALWNGCASDVAMQFNIELSPQPEIVGVSDVVACPYELVEVVFTSDVSGTTFNWVNDNTTIGLAASGSGNISFTAAGNSTTSNKVATIKVTPVSPDGLKGNPATFTITLKPAPVVAVKENVELCPGESKSSIDFTSLTMPGMGYFSWEVGNRDLLGLTSSTGSGSITGITAGENLTGIELSTMVRVTQTVDGCTSEAMTFQVIVKPQPVVESINNQAFCPGDQVLIPFMANTDAAQTTYSWQSSNPAIGLASSGTGAISFTAADNPDAGDISSTITYTATSGGCVGTEKNFVISIKQKPVMDQPADLLFCSGTLVKSAFSASMSGSSFSWIIDNPVLGMPASGNGDLNFTTEAFYGTVAEVSTVRVRATNNGCVSEEKLFSLTLKPLPKLVQQTELEIFPGQEVPATLFQDNSNGESTISWTATNASLIGLTTSSGTGSIPAFKANDNTSGGTIESSVNVNALWNGCEASAMQFLIKLRPRPIMVPEGNLVACPGEAVKVVFESNVNGTTYNWVNSNTAIGLPASGSGNISFTSAENNSGAVREADIVVTPLSPDGFEGSPVSFKIAVNPLPLINDVANIAICPGESANVDFIANTIGETFYWQNSNTLIGLPANGEGDITFTGVENFSGANRVATITYFASREGCKSIVKSFTITLKNQPVPKTMAPSSLCPSQAFTPAAFSDDTGGKSEFHWTIDRPELLGLTQSAGTGNLPVFHPADNFTGESIPVTIQYYSILNGCISKSLIYNVRLLPVSILVNEDITACANEALRIELQANTGGGESYSWTNSNTTIGLTAASGSGGIIEFTAVNTTESDQKTTITVSATKDGCTLPGQAFDITVKPLPKVMNPTAELLQNLCSGEAVVFNPITNLDKVSFSWTATSNVQLQNFKTSGTGAINEVVLNNTNQTATIKYTILPVRTDGITCTGKSVELLVYIAPRPDLQLSQPTIAVCNGEELIITPSSTTTIPETYYEWTVAPNDLGISSGSGNEIVQTYFVENNIADTIEYTIRAVAGNCKSAPQTVKVFIRPFAIVSAGEDITFCEEEPILLQATLGGSATFGIWSGGAGDFQNPLASTTIYRPDPSEIGSSIQFIFTTNDPIGPCTAASDTVNVMIEPLPEVAIINLPKVYCLQDALFELEGNPANGTFSGEGVFKSEENRYYFNPAEIEMGGNRSVKVAVTYAYRSSNGCTGTDVRTLEVDSGPDASFDSVYYEVCETYPSFLLRPTKEGGKFEGNGVVTTNGKAFFNPGSEQVNIGNNIITYTITEGGCTNSSSQSIRVYAKPTVNIVYENLCLGDNSIQFQAVVNNLSENDKVTSYQWTFGGGVYSDSLRALRAPVMRYDKPGIYEVTLNVTTALGCDVTTVKQNVVVSNFTTLNFSFENICGNDTTVFAADSIAKILDYYNPEYMSLEYEWNFGDPEKNEISESISRHKFSDFGEYVVQLTVRSNILGSESKCEKTVSKRINIVPAISEFPYVQQFKESAAEAGWFTEGTNNSWQYGMPAGQVINAPAIEGTNVWATHLGDSAGYADKEISYIISPCFDLKGMDQPMISMNLFLHTEPGRDGAVLQYSTNGGGEWKTLGKLGEGLDWYNSTNIVADPAVAGIGNEGWSGMENQWKEVAYSLDALSSEFSSAMFRIAFASDERNVGDFEGIALDDVYVGPRNKKVLIENFTNINAAGFTDNVTNFSGLAEHRLTNDMVLLQYHTPFPVKDSVHLRNQQDPGARSLFYGISKAPTIVIDGELHATLDTTVISRQSLSKPDAIINISVTEEADGSLLKGTVELAPVGPTDKELILYINAVEVEAESGDLVFRNVLKKILPESYGIYLNGLNAAQTFDFEWMVSSDFAAGNLGVVAYLQEKDSKRVLQSSFMPVDVSMKAGELTSISEINLELQKLRVFPNPVRDVIVLQTSSLFARELKYELISLGGIVLQKGSLAAAKKEYRINAEGLIDGMYILRVFTDKSEPASFKVLKMGKKNP